MCEVNAPAKHRDNDSLLCFYGRSQRKISVDFERVSAAKWNFETLFELLASIVGGEKKKNLPVRSESN